MKTTRKRILSANKILENFNTKRYQTDMFQEKLGLDEYGIKI